MKFIIEHLEPELYKWCVLEYKHISKLVGKQNLIVSNLKSKDFGKLKGFAEMHDKKAAELSLSAAKICILDPEAEKELTPADAKKFCYFVFGGILGDYPPRKRTKDELKLCGERRNIGKEQFPTDNAVYVVKKICKGTALGELKFQDELIIPIKDGEEVILPFRYVLVNGKPLVSKEIVEMLKKQKGF